MVRVYAVHNVAFMTYKKTLCDFTFVIFIRKPVCCVHFLFFTRPYTHIELDKYVTETGIVPDAITCDTEGSELLIFKGAEKTLKEHHPQIWVSVHDELAKRDYGV